MYYINSYYVWYNWKSVVFFYCYKFVVINLCGNKFGLNFDYKKK